MEITKGKGAETILQAFLIHSFIAERLNYLLSLFIIIY